jgi:hypothetical protein
MPRRGSIWTVHSLLPQKVSGSKTIFDIVVIVKRVVLMEPSFAL